MRVQGLRQCPTCQSRPGTHRRERRSPLLHGAVPRAAGPAPTPWPLREGVGVRGRAEPEGAGPTGGGASPEPRAENLTTKGSRLKESSGSGYWYVSTTDTEYFLDAKGGWVR